ncbi:hypothetical protein TRFO_35679 [Tritrichomonas foetus]|uniref:PQ loop repeat family protein n=1 Tax=Tritrichomonas foetus TaxID=1144522 RepID=A0A1J4JKF3_9EUKA|nr:hypothetical protein TRFO_35679 [Tritrichomonas foetus]|eukprot:OHS98027.1 hypothetical protein TRFO_35679 [Tritrichomonas foetus]
MILSISSLSFLSTLIFYLFPNMPYVIFDLLCVFAPMTGYFDQLIKMFQTKNSSKFKSGSSLVLLFSNFLRILYWFGNRFAPYLLWQSIVTIIVHIALCYAYYKFIDPVSIKYRSEDPENSNKFCFNFHPFEVHTFLEFILTLMIFWVLIIAIVIFLCFFFPFRIITDFIGLISNLIDSFQTFPPFYAIVICQDISCITTMLAMQYVAATFMKAVLFLCRPVPWPFRVGVAFQAFFVFFITFEYVRRTCLPRRELSVRGGNDYSDQYSENSEDVRLSSEYSD